MSNAQNDPAVLGPLERRVRPGAEAGRLMSRIDVFIAAKEAQLLIEAKAEIEGLELALRALLIAKWCTPEYEKACRVAASLLHKTKGL